MHKITRVKVLKDYRLSVSFTDGTRGGVTFPHSWGLYDMLGNVWEWSRDWYGDYQGTVADPMGATSGSSRVFRGGSCYDSAHYCRSACQSVSEASERSK